MPMNHRSFAIFILTLILVVLNYAVIISPTWAQDECKNVVNEARNEYFNFNYDKAIVMLIDCLNKSTFSKTDSVQAYRLLAECYISKQNPSQATNSIEKLLNLSPAFEPVEGEDSPELIRLIKELQEERQERLAKEQKAVPKPAKEDTEIKKTGSKKLIWIMAGIAAAGVAVAVALATGGNGGGQITNGQRLPDPPGAPGGN